MNIGDLVVNKVLLDRWRAEEGWCRVGIVLEIFDERPERIGGKHPHKKIKVYSEKNIQTWWYHNTRVAGPEDL